MADTGTPPVIPPELQQYNSYVEDPKWQIKFTIAWTAVLAFFVVLALPAAIHGRRKWAAQIFGVSEDWRGRYARLDEPQDVLEKEKKSCCGREYSIHEQQPAPARKNHRIAIARIISVLSSVFYWTPPGFGLNAGQILLTTSYASAVLACICTSAPLISNSNRAGFLALAQLPPIFLLSSKNTPLSLLLLLPPSSSFAYTRLNPLHRWAGRTMVLAAVVHGSLWIRNHLEWGVKIVGEQKETSGVAALGVLGVVGVSSLRPVRVCAWGVFYWVHFLAVPAFFITVCYHTIYAAPWIIPPIAIYAFDIFMRAARFRLKDAHLIRVDNQMTLIHIPDCDAGFRAGQHLRVRVFFGGRAFEAHPLSIMCGPSSSSSSSSSFSGETTCLRTKDVAAYYDELNGNGSGGEEDTTPGILLGVRAAGDWTRALNEYAVRQERIAGDLYDDDNDDEGDDDDDEYTTATKTKNGVTPPPSSSSPAPKTKTKTKSRKAPMRIPIPVQVMFDGPYGGCSLDLTEYERVLLVAGGSGATFAVGLVDGVVGAARAAKGKEVGIKTRRVHFVWCTRSFGSIKWFAPLLRALALAASSSTSRISLRMTIYVTCMCSPEEVGVPGLEVRVGGRPDMKRLVGALVAGVGADDDFGAGGVDGADGVNDADGAGPVGRSSGGSEEELCECGCVEETLEAQTQTQTQVQVREAEAEAEKDVEKQGPSRKEWFGGALAVCASGPESLTREVANAVAGYAGRGREVGLHTEVFAV